VIEVACTIAPLCGMPIFDVMWQLPASVAYQIFNVVLQSRGFVLVTGPTEQQLINRLRRCQM
jgi:hypothetical protein